MSTTQTKYHFHISSQHKKFNLNLKEVWQYRDLIVLFTKRTFSLIYKQTILGPIWIFLNPFLTSFVYSVVFGGIAGMSTNGVPRLLFYLSSNAIWTLFSSCLTTNATTFTTNAAVFGKVYFPRLAIPISTVFSSIIQFLVQMIMVVVLMIYYAIRGEVSPNWFAFPLIVLAVLQLGIMGLGFGIIISSLTTKYRDLAIAVTFGVQLWMYATPIVYPISELGDGLYKTILLLNPVTTPVEAFRYALLGQGQIEPFYWALSWAVTLFVAIVGIMIFNKVEKTFTDTV